MVYSFITIIPTTDTAHKETMDFITDMVKDYNLSNNLRLKVSIKSLYEFMTILFHLMLMSFLFIFLLALSNCMREVRLRLHYVIIPSQISLLKYI